MMAMKQAAEGSLARGLTRAFALAVVLAMLVTVPVMGQAASYKLPALDGARELTPKTLSEGATILVVWASWSPRCRDITDRVDAINTKWRDRANVVTINFQEKSDDIRAALAKDKMPVPVYLDENGAFSKMHAVTTVPHVLVYVDGKKVHSQRLTRDIDQVIASKLP